MKVDTVLLTGTMMPSALTLAQGFDAAGATVLSASPSPYAPGAHSKHTKESFLVPAPSKDPLGYARELAGIVAEHGVDLIVPVFEDVFYDSRYRDTLGAPLFAPPFASLAEVHSKARFMALCARLGLPTPSTTVVSSADDLRAAIASLEHYVAKPAYSRGGAIYLTNDGPRADETSVDEVTVSAENPWLVQEFVDGIDACCYCIARDGEIVLHCPYKPSIEGVGGYAIQFTTLEDYGALEMARTIAGELSWNGSIAFDFRLTDDGPVLLECNPRCTSGTFMTDPAWLVEAITADAPPFRQVPAGIKAQYDAALLTPAMNTAPLPTTLHELFTVKDPDFHLRDVAPGLYFFRQMFHWSKVAKEEGRDLVIVASEDIAWDGQELPAPQPA